MQNTNELYESNADFKDYVDKYAKKHNEPVETVLTFALIKEYAVYLQDRMRG